MKVAVILSGNIRTWELSNLRDFVDVDVDYFISTTNKRYNYHPFICGKYGYESINNEIITNEDIENILNLKCKKLIISEDELIDDGKFHPNMRNIESCYHQYNRIYRILGHIEEYENENNFKYDLVIKTRFDLFYNGKLSDHLVNFDCGSVTYDDGNDTLVISERETFFNIIRFIISEFYHQSDPFSHECPPHGLLRSALSKYRLVNNDKKINQIIRY